MVDKMSYFSDRRIAAAELNTLYIYSSLCDHNALGGELASGPLHKPAVMEVMCPTEHVLWVSMRASASCPVRVFYRILYVLTY